MLIRDVPNKRICAAISRDVANILARRVSRDVLHTLRGGLAATQFPVR